MNLEIRSSWDILNNSHMKFYSRNRTMRKREKGRKRILSRTSQTLLFSPSVSSSHVLSEIDQIFWVQHIFPLAEYLVQGASNYSRRKTECLEEVKLLNFNRYGRGLFTFLFTSDVSFILSINLERSGSRSASLGLKGFWGKAKRWTWSIQSYYLLSEAPRKTGGRRDLEVWPIAVSAPSILITDPPLSVGHLLSRRVMGKGWGIGTALLHFLCCSERQSARRMFAVISKRDWLSRSWIKEGIWRDRKLRKCVGSLG